MDKDYPLHLKNIKSIIQFLISSRGFSQRQIKDIVNTKYSRTDTEGNFSDKIIKERIHLKEFLELAEILDYEVIIRDKSKKD